MRVAPDGSITVDGTVAASAPQPVFDVDAHAGLLTFLDVTSAMEQPPPRVKVQIAGPLTLGVALHHAGMPVTHAFRRGAEASRAWAVAVDELVATRLPDTTLLLFFDEPALVEWNDPDPLLDHEAAVDVLSGALAAPSCATGVHVCGGGNRRLALEAGPHVLGVEVRDDLVADADVLARHLDAGGWIAWGAVPTDRPVGESSEPLWRALASVWCELTRARVRSCPAADPERRHPRVRPRAPRADAGRARAAPGAASWPTACATRRWRRDCDAWGRLKGG